MQKFSIRFPSKILSLGSSNQAVDDFMKKLAAILIILLPCISSGQLFPKIPDFNGNVKELTEKRYGRQFDFFGLIKEIYLPGLHSGRVYTYQFDKKSTLIRKTDTFHGKIEAEYLYQYDTIDNRRIEREIASEQTKTNPGDYLEYENILDREGRIEKVISTAYNSKECTREIFLLEQNAEYESGRLTAFTRQNVNPNGEALGTEKCSLFYNSSGQIIRIERKDIETGLTTILYYSYNGQGFIDHYSVDFLVGLEEYGTKSQNPEIYYDYDNSGNWIKMYWKFGDKPLLKAKRSIEYW